MKNNKDLQKLFKCVVCKHKFYAQESDELRCPSCNSFNIALAKENTVLAVAVKVLVFLAAGVIGFFLTPLIMGNQEEPQVAYVEEPIIRTDGDIPTQSESCDTIETVQDAIAQEIEIKTFFDEVVNKNYIYSFNAHCNLDGQKTLTYELLDAEEDKVVMSNADGKFVNIQPSATGEYRFRVRVKEDGRISEAMLVTGFAQRPVVKITPLSKDELESIINQGEVSSYMKDKGVIGRIYDNAKIKYNTTSKAEDPVYLVRTSDELAYGNWKSVKVIDVEYNEINQVKAVLLDVVYP